MKKRVVAIVLVAIALLGLFTSCEKKEVAVEPSLTPRFIPRILQAFLTLSPNFSST